MHTPHPFQWEIPGWTLNPAEACHTAAISLPAPVLWRHLWDPPLWWPETLPDSRQLLGAVGGCTMAPKSPHSPRAGTPDGPTPRPRDGDPLGGPMPTRKPADPDITTVAPETPQANSLLALRVGTPTGEEAEPRWIP